MMLSDQRKSKRRHLGSGQRSCHGKLRDWYQNLPKEKYNVSRQKNQLSNPAKWKGLP